MTVESRVRKVIGDIRGEGPDSVDLDSKAAMREDDTPVLASRLVEEFGQGVFRGLLPYAVITVRDMVMAILPALEAGPRYCWCSKESCVYRGPGKDGASCPNCPDGTLICKIL